MYASPSVAVFASMRAVAWTSQQLWRGSSSWRMSCNISSIRRISHTFMSWQYCCSMYRAETEKLSNLRGWWVTYWSSNEKIQLTKGCRVGCGMNERISLGLLRWNSDAAGSRQVETICGGGRDSVGASSDGCELVRVYEVEDGILNLTSWMGNVRGWGNDSFNLSGACPVNWKRSTRTKAIPIIDRSPSIKWFSEFRHTNIK